MKMRRYYLKGNQVNGQFSCKPEYLKLKFFKYVWMIRVWRFQVCADLRTNKSKQ